MRLSKKDSLSDLILHTLRDIVLYIIINCETLLRNRFYII